jgi:hypothetical protein
MKQIYLITLVLIVLVGAISAATWTPPADIDMKNFYKIINVTNITSKYYCNATNCYTVTDFLAPSGTGVFVPYFGATGPVNLNGQALTNLGSLIINGLSTTQDLVPNIDNLYSIGNSTNRYASIYANNIYGKSINSTDITSTNIDTKIINSGNANVSDNLTIAGFPITKQGNDLIITLK